MSGRITDAGRHLACDFSEQVPSSHRADPSSKVSYVRKTVSRVGRHQVAGELLCPWPISDLLWGVALSYGQHLKRRRRSAATVQGESCVFPVTGAPFGGDDPVRIDLTGVIDRRSVIAQYSRNTNLVFARDPANTISAVIVDATSTSLERKVIEPLGLGGWSWGVLRFHGVPVNPQIDLLGRRGDGIAVFRRHFAGFRPIVAATAIGAAAGVHSLVTRELGSRQRRGVVPRIRDNALIALGRTHAELLAGLQATIMASRLTAIGHPQADIVARMVKASGVDTAYRAVSDIGPLVGASGYQHDHPIAKARTDLLGLLYADGIHDSLYRSVGVTLLRQHVSSERLATLSR